MWFVSECGSGGKCLIFCWSRVTVLEFWNVLEHAKPRTYDYDLGGGTESGVEC